MQGLKDRFYKKFGEGGRINYLEKYPLGVARNICWGDILVWERDKVRV